MPTTEKNSLHKSIRHGDSTEPHGSDANPAQQKTLEDLAVYSSLIDVDDTRRGDEMTNRRFVGSIDQAPDFFESGNGS